MNLLLLLPLFLAVVAAVIATAAHRRLRPDVAAVLLTGAIAASTLAVLPAVLVLSLGFLTHLPILGGGFEWCHTILGLHADINPWVGGAATLLLVAGAVRSIGVIRKWRLFHRSEPGGLEVVNSEALFAYSLPGSGQRVAVSSGMIGALDRDEFAIVMAHERSHAEHRHDRHLLLADLAVAVVPFMMPLRLRLRFVLERWADESVVTALGADRRTVARTLARVALAQSEFPTSVAAFNGLGVAARVEALLQPPALTHQRLWLSTMYLGVGFAVLAAGVQAHHLFSLLVTLCPG